MFASIANPIILTFATPIVGSFLALLVVRLPIQEPFVFSRSHCRSCHAVLAPQDLIPIISWSLLGGKCRHCRVPVSLLYPGMELGALVVVLWAAHLCEGIELFAAAILGWLLLTLAVIDWRTSILPDVLTLGLLLSGVVMTAVLQPNEWGAHILGALLGFVSFWTIGFIYKQARKIDGLGLGDAKLLAGIGVWVSWEGLASVVLIASLVALAYLVARQVLFHDVRRTDRLPFGPFLALGCWLVWLYAPAYA